MCVDVDAQEGKQQVNNIIMPSLLVFIYKPEK